MLIKKFLRFSCLGAIGTLAQFMILTGLVELMTISPIIASNTGMVIGALINYTLSRHLAFNSRIPHRKTLLKFFLASLIGLLFNSIIMHATVPYMPYLFAQIFATGLTVFWNFSANHYWTFNPKHEPS